MYGLWSGYVNSEGIETVLDITVTGILFESSVNSEGIETIGAL